MSSPSSGELNTTSFVFRVKIDMENPLVVRKIRETKMTLLKINLLAITYGISVFLLERGHHTD